MEKITDAAYREMGMLVGDSVYGERAAREYTIIDIEKKEYVFSFIVCCECVMNGDKPCLLFATLIPLFHKEENNFSKKELEKYLYGR